MKVTAAIALNVVLMLLAVFALGALHANFIIATFVLVLVAFPLNNWIVARLTGIDIYRRLFT